MQLGYVNYTNVDAGFARPYRPGDRLVRGFAGEIDGDPADLGAVAEGVFARHNQDDRPDGPTAPSLSIGDVIVFGELAVSVDRFGFTSVELDPADLIVDRGWREVMTGPSVDSPAPVWASGLGGGLEW